ncbi:hypothetical protein DSO57_1039576 [Entomophthora muscae]|uniref:Uncharacterized protein n=2 Tax=Entomophthora muscae TaxID=34485 RepID=A0ACC2TK96_9FUNG|nr:hypothetical protein DSO57_1024961 [Entomophthora muscae]KAJ9075094.1 hypothetical protein DSO57_1039576 [Entomophthora muscae]
MTLPLTPQPDHPMKTPTAAETISTQLFGVLYIILTEMMDSMVPTSGPRSLLGQSMSYIIKLAPILWWALPTSLAQPHPKPPNASIYAWFPDGDAYVPWKNCNCNEFCKVYCGCNPVSSHQLWLSYQEDPNWCPYFDQR